MSFQSISAPKKKMVKKLRKRSSDNSDVLAEEQEYRKKLKWLKEHGDLTGEEENNHGDESSGDEASST
jgi:flagellar biosynthesis chaperone FliJ